MADAIDNYQESLALTEYVPLSGFFPSSGPGFGYLTLGMIRQFAGIYGPIGAPAAQGQLLDIGGNPALFTLFGTTFGGNGTTNFALPDLRVRSAVGDGQGTGLGHDHSLGAQSGAGSLLLTQPQMPGALGGTSQPFANEQPSQAFTYLIRTNGNFPSGSSDMFIGEVVKFGGNFVPSGYLEANGQLVLISENTALFTLLGTTYGGNGTTNFALPDLRGRNAIGASEDAPFGTKVGSETPVLANEQLPFDVGGDAQAFDNRGPGLALNYIIKVVGSFPSSSGSGGAPENEHYQGEVTLFAGNSVPPGWALCNGQILTIGSNTSLFSLIGTLYGGDGETAFALPDFTDRTALGATTAVPVGMVLGSNGEVVELANVPVIDATGTAGGESLYGGDGADWLKGLGGGDTLISNAGNDRLDGGTDADTMVGGKDNDTYYVDNFDDVIVEVAGGGTLDTVEASATFYLAADDDVERMRAKAGTDPIKLRGNELTQKIEGNKGDNSLSDGGAGASDTLLGSGGNDLYRVYNAGDIIIEISGQGTDVLQSAVSFKLAADDDIEKLQTISSTANTKINLTGNALAQQITGNAGLNTLDDGGAGASDTMIGLGGNDIYHVNNSADVIKETSTQGTNDRVETTVSYTLGKGVHVEGLATTSTSGTAGLALYGNELQQTITGNAGDNSLRGYAGDDTINGGGGNDKISGGLGNDTLAGNTGADTYYFSYALDAATNVDTISGFSSIDLINLSAAIFTQAGPAGTLASAAFAANKTGFAGDADDRIVYETDTGKISYDPDGTGAAAATLFAIVGANLALNNADFVIA